MKKSIYAYIIIAFSVLIALVGAVFSVNFIQDEDVPYGLSVFNEDGSVTRFEKEPDTSMKLAHGDPTLLNYSEISNIVIFICFSDENIIDYFSSVTLGTITDKFNGESMSLYDYYRTLSYGKFTVRSSFAMSESGTTYFVYKDSHPRSYYTKISAKNGKDRYDPESTLLNNAVKEADAYFDYSGIILDANDDNYVDSVSFVISGSAGSTWGALMWPHAWNLDTITKSSSSKGLSSTLNGVQVDTYTFTFSSAFQIGLLAHEFGHIIGLPDLYHYDYDTNKYPVGRWDLMHLNNNTPQYMLTYMRKSYLDFVDPSQICELTLGGEYALKPVTKATKSDILAYKVTVSATESIWLEYRLNASGTYDCELPGSGLLVYRINTSASGNEDSKYQNARYPDEVFIYRPNASSYTDISSRTEAELYDLARSALSPDGAYSTLGNSEITDKYSSSCIFLSNGANSGIVVTVTARTDDELTFNINLGEYDCSDIRDSYVVGKTLSGSPVKSSHYMYVGEEPELSVFVKYSTRSTEIELRNYEISFTNTISESGQTAFIVFTDAYGERKIPFTLYIYDIVEGYGSIVKRPTKSVYNAGENLDLSGLYVSWTYRSGRTETVVYSEENAENWVVLEGLDIKKSGTYDHILIRYGEKAYFILNGIKVLSKLSSIAISEENSRHFISDMYKAQFNVTGIYADGTTKTLTEEEYNVFYSTKETGIKSLATIQSTENTNLTASFNVYFVTDTVSAITQITAPEELDVTYGFEPSLEKGVLEITFSDGFSLETPMENYKSQLLKTYIPTKVGKQTLSMSIGSISYSLEINVFPKSNGLLSADGNEHITVYENSATIIVNADITLAEFYSSLVSAYEIMIEDAKDGYELSVGAFPERKTGTNLKLKLITPNNALISEFSVYRMGDADGDGTITEEDKAFWISTLLTGTEHGYGYLDMNGDGKYSLADFVLLLRLRGKN